MNKETKIFLVMTIVILITAVCGTVALMKKDDSQMICLSHSFIKDEYWIVTMKSDDNKEALRRPTLVCKNCGILKYELKKR